MKKMAARVPTCMPAKQSGNRKDIFLQWNQMLVVLRQLVFRWKEMLLRKLK